VGSDMAATVFRLVSRFLLAAPVLRKQEINQSLARST
jgi:hypothetical protein